MSASPNGSKTPGPGGLVFWGSPHTAWAAPLLVLLAAAWFYRVVADFGYVWDDRAFFVTSTELRSGDLLHAITTPVLAGTAYFRPLVMVWFVAELRLLSAEPSWLHLTNLLLHLANMALVGLLVRKLLASRTDAGAPSLILPALAMLAYGLHPALTEAVAWISGRFDLTVTFFSLLALLLATSTRPAVIALAAPVYLLAACSKEMAATVPVLAFLLLWALRRPDAGLREAVTQSLRGPERFALAALLAGGIAYLVLRAMFLQNMVLTDPSLMAQLDGPGKRIAFVGQTLAFYVRTALWPFMGMGPLHPFDVAGMTPGDVVRGIVVVVASLAFCAWSLWRPTRARLLAVAALVSLLPVLNIVPLSIVGNIGHERFLPLPLALAVLSVASMEVKRWPVSPMMRQKLPLLLGAAGLAWTLVSALNVHVTLPLWRNNLTLWSWAYSLHPESPFAQFSLTAEALQEGRYELARQVLTRAEQRGPIPLRLSVPYGMYLIRTGETQAGVEKIEAALRQELQPHLSVLKAGVRLEDAQVSKHDFSAWLLVYAYAALSEGYSGLRQFGKAEEAARIAIFYQRDNPLAHTLRSFAMYGQDRWDEAEAAYATAHAMYAAAAREGADRLRKSFLQQLCGKPEDAPRTCTRVHADPALKAPAAQ